MLNKIDFNQLLKLLVLPFAAFILGYSSKSVLDYNYDFLFHHSFIIFILLLLSILINFLFRKFNFNKEIELIIISFFSCSILGIALITIQENLLFTRWLELGLFPSDDATDYVSQSAKYLTDNNIYSNKGRVIFPLLYSGFLAEFKFNTKIIQLILTGITAFTTFYTSLIIYKRYGFLCSVIFCSLCTDFLIEHVGGANTENIGYILGGISFIFFFKFTGVKDKKIINLTLFLLFLFIAYMIRPSIPFFLPIICIWSFIYIKSISNTNFYRSIISFFLLGSILIYSNNLLFEYKAPESPKEFGNIYDSWYATQELGKYYLSGKYEEIPGTLWTKILKDYPEINNLKGREFVNAKKNIVFDTFKNDTENYLVGSILQIKNFFNKSKNYVEKYDNSSGFLFIEFYYYRNILLILFLIGGFLAIYYFLRHREKFCLLILLIFISVLFSQPFIFGGEARTIASVIFFVNLVVIFPVFKLKEIFFSKQRFNNLNLYNDSHLSINYISWLSFSLSLFLLYFFIKALNNNYPYIKEDYKKINLVCKDGQKNKKIIFNSQSGFFLNTHQKNSEKYFKDFSKILDVYADISSILISKNALNYSYTMSNEEIFKRDSFKFLNRFNNTNNGRLLLVSSREDIIFNSMVKQFLTDKSYYIRPFNSTSKKLDDIIVLRVDLVKEGLNKISLCM